MSEKVLKPLKVSENVFPMPGKNYEVRKVAEKFHTVRRKKIKKNKKYSESHLKVK